jgi:hypothetical protein
MALKRIDNFVSNANGRWFLMLYRAIVQVQDVTFRRRLRTLHVIKGIASDIQTGLTGRGDLTRDLSSTSGATTCEILARDNSGPF